MDGDADFGDPDSPTECSAATFPDQLEEDEDVDDIDIENGSFDLPATIVGTYDLTVTCQDEESAVHTTAKITVRAAIVDNPSQQ